jgi:hypothetical protein
MELESSEICQLLFGLRIDQHVNWLIVLSCPIEKYGAAVSSGHAEHLFLERLIVVQRPMH